MKLLLMLSLKQYIFLLILGLLNSGHALQAKAPSSLVITGAAQGALYLPLLHGKSIALVANSTSQVNDTHLLDALLAQGVMVKVILAPEHGFRGQQDAGCFFEEDAMDEKSGLPILSLYKEKSKRLTPAMLEGVDVVIFDMQDVGVRFFTYISTLHYVMEACAAYHKPLIVLDRPNPNAHYVDGPILEKELQSFVGMHPIPIVYGLTIGELARMINGEGWLAGGMACDLTVIPLKNYTHQTHAELPCRPSPNLTNGHAIRLYPTLGLFEGTIMSVGRGTPFPFEVVGYPAKGWGEFQFTPIQTNPLIKGGAIKYGGKDCHGVDLRSVLPWDHIDLSYLIHCYQIATAQGVSFWLPSFEVHAGTHKLRKQIEAGFSEEMIRSSWQDDLAKYKVLREKYLLYP